MSIFSEGDDFEDYLLDMYLLESMGQRAGKGRGCCSGCLCCFLLMLAVPVGLIIGLVNMLA